MNVRYTIYFTGKILRIVAFMFLFPSLIAIIYGEYYNLTAFLPLGGGMFAVGLLCSLREPRNKRLTATEGFIIVALSWVFISVTVAFAYLITGEIGGFINCFFEAVSGFTTTGASVVPDVEILSYSVNALRCFTHWVGGMGILVLVLAIIPKNTDATTMNIFKAEVPGHQVEKFTDKLTLTAKILYLIYTGMTIILIIATVGMFMFGVNMNIFYLILIGKFTTAIRSEELRTYTILFVVAILTTAGALTINKNYESFGESLRYSSFQIASIMSTTGMYVEDFSTWTALCQAIIFMLMFIGGCSGSTAGGMKISRIMIAGKYARIQYYRAARPNRIKTLRLEGERLEGATIASTMSFLGLYIGTVLISLVLVALFDDVFISDGGNTFTEKLTAVVSCMSNVGPGFGRLAVGTYNGFSPVSKLILSFDMLAGRLEILPMLFLFNPMAWRLKS